MTEPREELYNPLGWSAILHILVAAIMMTSWALLQKQETIKPPAMMKAALVHAPKSTLAPQQKTQTQKPEPKKKEERHEARSRRHHLPNNRRTAAAEESQAQAVFHRRASFQRS